jgi:Arc/MetJ family transcription regulator
MKNMRVSCTTTVRDDHLIATAQDITGLQEKTQLIREALKALIERESARRLARLGGSEPALDAAPRRGPKGAARRAAPLQYLRQH